MESADFEESEKEYLKILKEKGKIKNIKDTLESFKEYLTIIINSVNDGSHNEEMTDDLCKMINKYYKNLDSDVQSDNESNSEDESSDSSDEESNSSSNEEPNNSNDEESNSSSDEESNSSSNEESNDKKEVTKENESDNTKSYINFFQPTKTEVKKEVTKKEDIYFETFINNSVDINKRVFPINHDVAKKIKIYTQKVYSY
jgi:hypothetical protein